MMTFAVWLSLGTRYPSVTQRSPYSYVLKLKSASNRVVSWPMVCNTMREREHRERGKAKEGESGNPAYICIDSQWLVGVHSVRSATVCLRYVSMGVDTVTIVPVCM